MQPYETSYKLLKLLNDGQFHSGEALGRELGITRSAIWKAIKHLNELNLNIKAVSGKGYHLPRPIELLELNQIKTVISLATQQRLDNIILLDQVGSTNDYLLKKTHSQNKPLYLACFAEQQMQGKGRRGRHWASPYGTNLYHSILWHFDKDPAEIVGLSLAIAVATVRALHRYGITQNIQLKWPNDIVHNQHKLAGVLLEMVAEPYGNCSVVIGVGVNTHMNSKQAQAIEQQWTSIENITQTAVKRNQLAGLLLDELVQALLQFQHSGLAAFTEKWHQLDAMRGKSVKVLAANQTIYGVMRGISATGELILQQDDKQLKHFLSGEVSLRLNE